MRNRQRTMDGIFILCFISIWVLGCLLVDSTSDLQDKVAIQQQAIVKSANERSDLREKLNQSISRINLLTRSQMGEDFAAFNYIEQLDEPPIIKDKEE